MAGVIVHRGNRTVTSCIPKFASFTAVLGVYILCHNTLTHSPVFLIVFLPSHFLPFPPICVFSCFSFSFISCLHVLYLFCSLLLLLLLLFLNFPSHSWIHL